jgi:hypothetical protein
MRIRIRIQQLKLMRFHADPDPKPWGGVNIGARALLRKGLTISLAYRGGEERGILLVHLIFYLPSLRLQEGEGGQHPVCEA